MELFEDEMFCFLDGNSHEAICRIRLFNSPDNNTVVIATELDENPGMSVTNSWECLAGQVWESFGVSPKSQWVEHYPASDSREETWSLVTFSHISSQMIAGKRVCHMTGVTWSPLKPEDVQVMTSGVLP